MLPKFVETIYTTNYCFCSVEIFDNLDPSKSTKGRLSFIYSNPLTRFCDQFSTNQSKFNKRPSEYFRERLKEHGREKLEEILKSHIIPPEALDYLLSDDLENFMKSRRREIIEEIKQKVGIA